MLGSQRWIKARIGQLLGPANSTNGVPLLHEVKVIPQNHRHDFRILAHNWEPSFFREGRRRSENDVPETSQKRKKYFQIRCGVEGKSWYPNWRAAREMGFDLGRLVIEWDPDS
jgi:hypothetical protein